MFSGHLILKRQRAGSSGDEEPTPHCRPKFVFPTRVVPEDVFHLWMVIMQDFCGWFRASFLRLGSELGRGHDAPVVPTHAEQELRESGAFSGGKCEGHWGWMILKTKKERLYRKTSYSKLKNMRIRHSEDLAFRDDFASPTFRLHHS